MHGRLVAGDRVQTAMGKGTVRELRNSGQVLVDVQGRGLVFDASTVTPLGRANPARSRPAPPAATRDVGPESDGPPSRREIDLHGLTVEEALARVDATLDACMRDDIAQLRVIHGRSGGTLRAALHRRLRDIRSVRAFRLDDRNPGVTIVSL